MEDQRQWRARERYRTREGSRGEGGGQRDPLNECCLSAAPPLPPTSFIACLGCEPHCLSPRSVVAFCLPAGGLSFALCSLPGYFLTPVLPCMYACFIVVFLLRSVVGFYFSVHWAPMLLRFNHGVYPSLWNGGVAVKIWLHPNLRRAGVLFGGSTINLPGEGNRGLMGPQ